MQDHTGENWKVTTIEEKEEKNGCIYHKIKFENSEEFSKIKHFTLEYFTEKTGKIKNFKLKNFSFYNKETQEKFINNEVEVELETKRNISGDIEITYHSDEFEDDKENFFIFKLISSFSKLDKNCHIKLLEIFGQTPRTLQIEVKFLRNIGASTKEIIDVTGIKDVNEMLPLLEKIHSKFEKKTQDDLDDLALAIEDLEIKNEELEANNKELETKIEVQKDKNNQLEKKVEELTNTIEEMKMQFKEFLEKIANPSQSDLEKKTTSPKFLK